jgi:hypothetical protein
MGRENLCLNREVPIKPVLVENMAWWILLGGRWSTLSCSIFHGSWNVRDSAV